MSYGTRASTSSSPFDPSSIITHNSQMEEPSLNAAWGIPYRFFLCNQIKNDSLLVKYTPIKCQFHALSFFFYCQSLWNPAASLPQLHHKQFSCFPRFSYLHEPKYSQIFTRQYRLQYECICTVNKKIFLCTDAASTLFLSVGAVHQRKPYCLSTSKLHYINPTWRPQTHH